MKMTLIGASQLLERFYRVFEKKDSDNKVPETYQRVPYQFDLVPYEIKTSLYGTVDPLSW